MALPSSKITFRPFLTERNVSGRYDNFTWCRVFERRTGNILQLFFLAKKPAKAWRVVALCRQGFPWGSLGGLDGWSSAQYMHKVYAYA